MSSLGGGHVLKSLRITADAIYVDASHHEDEVSLDLELYWKLLRPGGVMFGDDYDPGWSGVIRAVDRFSAKHGELEIEGNKWLIRCGH